MLILRLILILMPLPVANDADGENSYYQNVFAIMFMNISITTILVIMTFE